jgi:hypothetical protein
VTLTNYSVPGWRVALALCVSVARLAQADGQEGATADRPQAHWSGLPIWGVEAAARGFELPLPFGIGVNYYHEQQPFNIGDLQVATSNRGPISVQDFAQIDQVDTSQSCVTARLDVWLFPFLSLYGLVGYTSGEMTGTIGLPSIPSLGIPSQLLPLAISYEGPTYGGGGTLAGGFKVSDWRMLTAFVVADANYTRTDLSFTDERLFTNTKATALVVSTRLGLRAKVTPRLHAAIWGGAMYQDVSESLIGRAADGSFAFLIVESPVAPWNGLIGGRLEIGRHFDLMVEAGIGTRSSILGGCTFRF